ncbi:hypothetical protein ONZ45_g16792 [Pleurotus djamor]|nr:hypothetical protein ONZ45_g16792 [Pleurotus djamor]
MHRDEVSLNHLRDFPELFGNKLTRQLVVPRIKNLMAVKTLSDYLIVLSLHVSDESNGRRFHIVSPSTALVTLLRIDPNETHWSEVGLTLLHAAVSAMDIRALNDPLKSFVLEASSRSLKGMRNLTSYLSHLKHALDRTQVLSIAHAVLSSLSVECIPPAATSDYVEVIQCAALSLSTIAYLANCATGKDDPFSSFFLQKEENICLWLSFFVNNVFCRDASSLDLSTPLHSDFVQDIFSYLACLRPIDFTRHVHISNAILETWMTLQAANLSEPALALAIDTGPLAFDVLDQGLRRTPPHDFILCLGGLTGIPELYVAFTRKYLAALELNSSLDFDSLYTLLLKHTLSILCIFEEKLIDRSLLSRDAIHQINISTKYLFDHCSRVKESIPGGDLTLVELYSNVILAGPALPEFYPILDMLEVGVAAHFRSIQFGEAMHPALIKLTQALFLYAKFPRAIPHIEKLLSLPNSSKLWLDWEISIKVLTSLWHETQAESKQYEGCAVVRSLFSP